MADPRNDTLSGVVVVEAEAGQIEDITAAESAKIVFTPDKRFNEVQITAHNTYRMGLGNEGSAEWLSLTAEFGSLLGDEIKFKKLDEMKRIRDVDLMLFDPIAKLARRVYAQFTVEALAQDIAAKAGGLTRPAEKPLKFPEDSSGFYRLHSGQRVVEFIAGRCDVPEKKEKRVELSEQVTVTEYDAVSGEHLRSLRCEKAYLDIEGDELTPTLTMELYNPTWQTAGGREGAKWGWLRIRGLIVPQTVEAATSRFRTQTGLKAAELASAPLAFQTATSSKLRDLQEGLQKKIRKTLAEIEAETHSRLVFGVGCLSMILIGIGLGIIFKGGHLLTAFGASCVPAAVLIVCIMMGRNVAKNLGAHAGSGIVLMWTGFIFLSLLAVLIYRRLLKN
jgi:hypothetical protein